MTLISGYNNDTTPSLSDKLLGTDGTNGGTINILVEDVLKLINGVSGKDYIQYKFSLTNHSNEGYFNTNESKTNPAEISKFFFNKQSTTKEDLTVLFTKLDTLQNIVISLRNPENTNNFATFKITNITINTTYFVFDVVLYKNFYSGDLVVGTIYSAYFDVKENFEDKTDKGGYEGTAQDLDDAKQNISQKGIADGYASLDVNGLVPASQLPSYVDDVLEFTNLAAFPVTGATGKIYIAIDSSLIYRWSGTIYIEIKDTSAVWGAITGTVTNQTDLINWINLNVVAATFLGTIIPTDMPTGSGSAYWLATQAGTYTNFGGVVVNANSFAIISRSDSGAFSISQTTLDITSKVNVSDVINTLTSSETAKPLSAAQGKALNEKIAKGIIAWTATAFASGDQVTHLGKDWVSNASTLSTDIPGTSSKWVERLSGYLINDESIILQLLKSFDSNLIFSGFVNSTTIAPANIINKVYLASETATIFGLPVIKGQLIRDTGIGFEIYTNNQFQFERKSSNYFDKNTILPDFLIGTSSGGLTSNTSWNVSDFIKVEPNTTYFIHKYGNSLQFDANKQPITSTYETTVVTSLSSKTITTVVNAFYIKISLTDVNLALCQVNKSNVILPYENFSSTLKIKALKDLTPVEFAPFIEKDFIYTEGKNLFDNSRITFGFLNSSGVLQTYSTGWYTSHYIEVKPNTTYYGNYLSVWSEFTENKLHIGANFHSTLPTQTAHTYTTSSTTKYIRLGFYETRLNTLQFELGSILTIYEQYIGKTIFNLSNGDKISFSENFNKIPKKWYGKKLLTIGDSITFRNQYQPYLKEILKISSYENKGVSGRVLRDMNYDTDGTTLLSSAYLSGFDLITIQDMANDYGTNRALGNIGDISTSGTFYGDLRKIIEYFSVNAPNVKLVLMSELKMKGYGFDWNQSNGAGVSQSQYNEAMKLSCKYYSIPFIDLLEFGGANEFNAASYYDGTDYVHPGAGTGMVKMAKIIASNIEII